MNKKSTLRKLLVAFALLASTSVSFGQVIFTEDFEGTPDPTTLLPANWTESGLSTDGIYNMGTNVTLSSQFFVIPAHTNFVATNDDVCDCNKSNDRLILPVQDFSTVTTAGLNINFDAVLFAQYEAEIATVEVSTDGGTTWTAIYTIPTVASVWQNNLTASLHPFIGQANVLISFKYNDVGTWAQGLAIDNVSIVQTTGQESSLQVTYGDYTIVPFTQITPITIDAKVTNHGINATASTPIVTEVYLNPNFTTPITTFTQTATNIQPGASSSLTMGVFTPTVIGDYVFLNYITTGDPITANDTVMMAVSIDQNEYARDNGTPTSAIGVGANNTCIIGSTFDVVMTAKMDSVTFMINPGATGLGNVVQVMISEVTGTTPGLTYIGQSAPFTLTAAHTATTGAIITLPVTNMNNGTLELTPGNYFVGIAKNTAAGPNYGLQCTDAIFTPGTVFGSIGGAAYQPLNSLLAGFDKTPIIRPYINPVCTLTATSVVTDANCGSTDGTATATAVNGQAPFTYLWNDGQTTDVATNLAQGTYAVVVTDANACEFTINNILVNNISTLSMTIAAQTGATCFGATDGTASVTAAGGTAPYTYVWSNNASTTDMATDLAAGTYTVDVTDDANCSNAITVTITEPTAITSTETTVAVLCNAGTNGSAEVTVAGGTAPYTYTWTGNSSVTNTISNVGAGVYTVEITDDNGCQHTQTATITEPLVISVSTTSTPETVSNDGTATSTSTGGTTPYTYSWSNGATTKNLTGLAAGTYTVTVTDANGCTQTSTVTVTSVVGITEIENGLITLYPNPSQGIITVSMDGIASGDVSMRIIDVTGKSVFAQKVLFDGNKTNYTLDLSSLENGTYLITLNMQEGTATRRIVIAN